MQNECIICFNIIDNINESKSVYNFHQECNCFYNVHSECLIKWINKYKTCIHCHKPLTYTNKNTIEETNIKTHIAFRETSSQKFKCCNIL